MIPRRKASILSSDLAQAARALAKRGNNQPEPVLKWERTFADFIGVKHAIAVSSGRSGLDLILRSLKLNAGDEVIIPAYTLKDLIPVIQKLQLVPVPVDIDLGSFNISPAALESKITARTKVILATHIFGMPCAIDKILEIAKNRSLLVIEDCAHSAGSEYQGKMTGSFGQAAFFSFESMKPVNTYGGGMVVTNNGLMADSIRAALAGYRQENSVPLKKIIMALVENALFSTAIAYPLLYLLSSKRWNSKLEKFYRLVQKPPKSNTGYSGFQARVGLEKIKTLQARIGHRQKAAAYLKTLLGSSIVPQEASEGASPNYYFFVALLPQDAWRVRRILLKQGIDAGIAGEITDNCGEILSGNCPNAGEVFRRAIQLPLYESISEQQLRRMGAVLEKALS